MRVALPDYYFHFARGFATLVLAHKLDSLVRVSRRDGEKQTSLEYYSTTTKVFGLELRSFELKTAKNVITNELINALLNKNNHFQSHRRTLAFETSRNDQIKHRELLDCRDSPLTFQRFQFLLTLFSKSFSSFPHGTCMLSESR